MTDVMDPVERKTRKSVELVFGLYAAMISCEGVIIENDEGDAAEEQKAPVWVLEDACRHGYPPTPLPACPSARELF
jgi:hypothetical protein